MILKMAGFHLEFQMVIASQQIHQLLHNFPQVVESGMEWVILLLQIFHGWVLKVLQDSNQIRKY
jgi:hypothetical protein